MKNLFSRANSHCCRRNGEGECREVAEKKAHRGRLWMIFGSAQFLRGMWEYFTLKRACARKILADAAQGKQEGIQGQWQQESPIKEVLEQVKRNADTDCNAKIMRRAYSAGQSGQLGKLHIGSLEKSKFSEWTSEKLQKNPRPPEQCAEAGDRSLWPCNNQQLQQASRQSIRTARMWEYVSHMLKLANILIPLRVRHRNGLTD